MHGPHWYFHRFSFVSMISFFSIGCVQLRGATRLPASGTTNVELRASACVFSAVNANALTLSDRASAAAKEEGGIRYLDILPAEEWTEQCGLAKHDIQYITFTAHLSVGTVIDIGGALIRIAPGNWMASGLCGAPAQLNEKLPFAAIQIGYATDTGIEWKSTNHEIPLQIYKGKNLATVALAIVKINKLRRSWSLSLRYELLEDAIPLFEPELGQETSISINAGAEGARVTALSILASNPLFNDVNLNDVPDVFEIGRLGSIVAAECPEETQKDLRTAWTGAVRADNPRLQLEVMAPDSMLSGGENQ